MTEKPIIAIIVSPDGPEEIWLLGRENGSVSNEDVDLAAHWLDVLCEADKSFLPRSAQRGIEGKQTVRAAMVSHPEPGKVNYSFVPDSPEFPAEKSIDESK
ncbi:MAG: hypothetical protein ACE145_16615 [Terriglobia bacterium]